jgi:metal-responsive CopG/Arc/MetJ family transcriptional regulator
MPKTKLEPEKFPNPETILMAVMIPRDLDKEIKEISRQNGVNRSQAVRWLIAKALRKPTMINLTLSRSSR